MSGPKGKQLEASNEGVQTANLADGVLAATVAGRAKMAAGLFDGATVATKFAAASIPDSVLAEDYVNSDGTVPFTADQSMGGFKLTNLATPTNPGDAAPRSYVEAVASTLVPKEAARLATIQRVSLDGTTPVYNATGGTSARGQITWATGPVTLDGVALVNADRLLLKNEQDGGGLGGAANGVWVRTAQNTWDRATDFDADAEVRAGNYVPVTEGTVNGDRLFLLTTNNPIVIGGGGGTALSFSSFGELQLGGAVPTTIQPDDAAAEGTAAFAARRDHRHAIVAATPGTTVKSEVTAAAEGASTSFLRADAQIQAATAAPVDVGAANAQGAANELSRADHVHRSPKPTTADKAQAPSATAGNFSTTGITITGTPALDGHVRVDVNGILYAVGDGDRDDLGDFTDNVACYFSVDGGATARAISAIAAGDTLYWNGTHAGFDLVAADRVSLHYETF